MKICEKISKKCKKKYLKKLIYYRKETAINQRSEIIESGWISSEISKLSRNFINLMQIELNRALDIILFLENYFDSFYGIPILESIEHLFIEIQVI